MTYETLFEGFDPAQYETEVKKRWGETEAYKQSKKRTSNYSKADWTKMKAEEKAIWQDAAKAMGEGMEAHGQSARDLAHRHREHICRWFYDCSPDMHKGLAAMWLADERFQNAIDAYGAGLTKWMAAAIEVH